MMMSTTQPYPRLDAGKPFIGYPTFPDDSLLSYLRKEFPNSASESRQTEVRQGTLDCRPALSPVSNLMKQTGGEEMEKPVNCGESHTHPSIPQQSSGEEEEEEEEEQETGPFEGEEEEEEEEEDKEKDSFNLIITPSALRSYTMKTLRQYIRLKKIRSRSQRKQDVIEAILAFYGVDEEAEEEMAEIEQEGEPHHQVSSEEDGVSKRGRRKAALAADRKTRKTPVVTEGKKKKKRRPIPHVKKEGPMPMILNDNGDLVYDRHAHLRNRENGSCHRCKNKKKLNIGCPFAKSHLFCRACVERHCGYDFDDMRQNITKYWANGCPVCVGACDCAYCKRNRKAGTPVTPLMPVTATSVVAPGSGQASRRGRKRKSSERNGKEEELSGDEDDVSAVLRKLKGDSSDEAKGDYNYYEGDDQTMSAGDQSPFTPKKKAIPPRKIATTSTRKRRRTEGDRLLDYFAEERENFFTNTAFDDYHPNNGVVRVSPAVIKKDGHYELLEQEADVEAFVGLIGAGRVLNHRHRTVTPPPPDD